MPDVPPTARPDLILVMTDQQRHDQVGYASGGHFETPSLDALAATGVVFDAAYSASTVCVPARVALLTGLQPHRLPTQENRFALREGFWTVAHALRHAGYETALIGKMHFAPVHADHGFETMRLCEHLADQGLGPLSRERGDVVDDYHGFLLEQGLTDWRLTGTGFAPSGAAHPPEAHPTTWVEREVSSFLAGRDRTRPLFLVVSFPHPHAPYDPPEPYASMYHPADSRLPDAGFEVNDQLPLVLRLAMDKSTTRAEASHAPGLRSFLATVRGLVRQIDDSIGRLVASLDLDRTLLLFTSDHGDYAGHRGLMRKNPWLPFDDLARVPFFVTGAGVQGGRRVTELVQSCDLALTCLDYAGVPRPAGGEFETRSLRPILEDRAEPADLHRSVLSATSLDWPMLRTGRFKYMEHIERKAKVLFDLEADPSERVNLGRDPDYEDVRVEMAERLRATLRQPVLDLPAPA